ncbi:MAG: ABC transporter permease [Chloroflexota bacterium]|nr:MAG: ABC transporter permease [Chloroflexota bacterium]
MRRITAIAWKDALIRFSSPGSLMQFLILPVIFTFLLAEFVYGGGEEAPIDLLVVEEDGSATAVAVLDELKASEAIVVVEVDRQEGEERFADEDAPALLIIPAGFEAAVLDGQITEVELRKQEGDMDANAVEQTVMAAVGTVGRPLSVAQTSVLIAAGVQPFGNETEHQAYFADSLEMAQEQLASAPARVEVTQKEDIDAAASFASAGQLVTWAFIPSLGIAATVFVFERVQGTMRRLVTTPTRSSSFLGGTIFGQFTVNFIQMLILVGFGIWVMNVDWGQSPEALLVMLVAFGLATVAFGTMLGTFVKTQSQAGNLSPALGMPMVLLAGCWFPIDMFPDTVATIVHVLPTTWAMQGLTDIILRGQGLEGIALEAAVLVGFAVVFFAVGVFRFRYE